MKSIDDIKVERFRKFLEWILDNYDEIHEGSDEEVRQELLEMGVDLEKAEKSFLETVERCKRKRDGKE